jgi:hypothetical protein
MIDRVAFTLIRGGGHLLFPWRPLPRFVRHRSPSSRRLETTAMRRVLLPGSGDPDTVASMGSGGGRTGLASHAARAFYHDLVSLMDLAEPLSMRPSND